MNIQTHIASKIKNLQSEPDTIVVLQGVPLAILPDAFAAELATIDWAALLSHPINYFTQEIVTKQRHVLLIEEYRLLKAYLLTEFPEIMIVRNNLYIDTYPVAAAWPADVRTALLAHFDADAGEETDLRAAENAMGIYGALFEQDGRLYAAYPEEETSSKVFDEPLFDEVARKLPTQKAEKARNLLDETDYLALVCEVLEKPAGPVALRITDYTGGKERLQQRLVLLASVADVQLVLAEEAAPSETFEHRAIYTELLQTYWHADAFRTFQVYDLAALARGEKKLRTVSQEAVIAQFVQEAEACGRGEQPRDLFVTAPTGAGKSAMFQIPAMVLAKEQKLMTLVISPLIGLMNDQVAGLEGRTYAGAATINSDITPIQKQEIMAKVQDGTYDILYLSPETLLARSDVEQLVGDRTLGAIVVDEAHIVTTWGKQFRPDYWYLGDHIRKLRKHQIQEKARDFLVAAFTATAIYGGREDMYGETIDSLHMIEPITYLGYVKRADDIHITIEPLETEKGGRFEYELDKFKKLEALIKGALMVERKTLIYFPTVSLIRKFWDYLGGSTKKRSIAMYYGSMDSREKQANYEAFLKGGKPIMLATKAFGMGIDIDDIENIIHFAPTGNVCDYVQEIGRAARKKGLEGEAIYPYNAHDFRYINQLQGMSAIRMWQLVGIVKKLLQTYHALRAERRGTYTKKRNAMLLDAENFVYLFGGDAGDQDSAIAKVKTALLLIQKDFEQQRGFSPITVRPIPLFGRGFFAIQPAVQRTLRKAFPKTVTELDEAHHICSVELEAIWKRAYGSESFPKFKYLVYSRDGDFSFNQQYAMQPALCVDIAVGAGGMGAFWNCWKPLKDTIYQGLSENRYRKPEELASVLTAATPFKSYEASAFIDVLLASIDVYLRQFSHGFQPVINVRTLKNGERQYLFNRSVRQFFGWVEHWFHAIEDGMHDGQLYLVQKEEKGAASIVLGLLEALNVLSFEMKGGADSKLYIYMYQTEPLANIVRQPKAYRNHLLSEIYARHRLSVAMLTYLYESGWSSEKIWDALEDYFLGIVPEEVKKKAFPEAEEA